MLANLAELRGVIPPIGPTTNKQDGSAIGVGTPNYLAQDMPKR
jgi:hypothetical protein